MPQKINNGLVRNGHDVYFFSDRDVARCSTVFRSRTMGVKPCNRKLIEVCKNTRPEVLVLGHADIIQPETLDEVRTLIPSVVIFQYTIDPVYSPPNRRKVLSKVKHVDHTFMTTAGTVLQQFASKNAPVSFFPNPVDSSIQTGQSHKKSEFKYDVFFAGGKADWADPNDIRRLIFPMLEEKASHLRCKLFGLGQGNDTWGYEFNEEIRHSKMGLNLSYRLADSTSSPGGDLYLYTSDRICLLMGNGLLTFSGNDFSLSELYGSDTLVEVASAEELLEKLLYYHEHDKERKLIASKGYELAHSEFNDKLVTQYMLETVLGEKYSHDYHWPTEIFQTNM